MEDNRLAGAFAEAETSEKRLENVTRTERLGVLYSAVTAYLYILAVFSADWRGWLIAFAAALCVGVELALRDQPARRESYVWLGCLWVCLICGTLGPNRVWGEWVWWIIHGFGVYWMIVRSGRCAMNGTSRYLPVDVFYGALGYPFMNYLLRVKVLFTPRESGRKRPSAAARLSTTVAACVAALLFLLAWNMLTAADVNFARLTEGIGGFLSDLDAGTYLSYLVISLPVGAFLYGMVFGARREPLEAVQARRERIDAGIRALRRVPDRVWPILIGGFAALYLGFFALQGSYLFSALASRLPEAYTAAQYARQGFFELCGVMALNFGLLFAEAISAEGGLRQNRPSRIMGTVLLTESMLFAVTAAAKLALYIQRFGFTPLRLQSSWLVVVLFAGCAAALRALWTGKDTVKPWLLFAGVTLALLHLY